MMINSFGKIFGLLSGGCLESDLMQQARKCWEHNENHTVCYDMQDESDIAWQLGIGCGGMVRVLLQPITKDNNYLDLVNVFQQLTQGHCVSYYQDTASITPNNRIIIEPEVTQTAGGIDTIFVKQIKSIPTMTIFGGGTDAVPLVTMAKALGWYVTLIDSRTNYARSAYFPAVDEIIKQPYETLTAHDALSSADAIVIMNHNLELDAKALAVSAETPCQYIGLLGPSHRTERVFNLTNLKQDKLTSRLANPIGIHLGGDLPESIALSILAEAHAHIENGSMLPMKHHVMLK